MSSNPIKVSIKVQPNAGKNEVIGQSNDVWKIRIAAPPEKGKANKLLIEFLGEVLKIKKDHITIFKGHTSHNKIVAIDGLTQAEVNEHLSRKK